MDYKFKLVYIVYMYRIFSNQEEKKKERKKKTDIFNVCINFINLNCLEISDQSHEQTFL